jgi:pilus assembly protein CpaF
MGPPRSPSTPHRAETDRPSDELLALKQRVHGRLVEEFDLKTLDIVAVMTSDQRLALRQRTERAVANLLAKELRGTATTGDDRACLIKEIVDEALGLGPLEDLLADPEITDILVNTKDEVYVERNGKLEVTSKRFLSENHVRTVIERIIAPLGRRIDESSPMVDARLPDGSRVNAIIPPLAVGGPVLSIRKFSRRRYTLEDLIQFGTLSRPMADFLRACVFLRKNTVISGGAGSGKTTLLNVLSAFIPDHERIVTIEDAVELQLAQRHWVRLEARPENVEGRGRVAARDLFRNALRMRPDRIIIGECRGEETLDMLQAMNTGHEGSMTTVHANSPRDVISRLDAMVLMSSIELPVRAIRQMVASAIQIFVQIARFPDGARKLTSISEVDRVSRGTEVILRDLFLYRQTGVAPDGTILGHFAATGQVPSFLEEVTVNGIDLDATIFASPAQTNGS